MRITTIRIISQLVLLALFAVLVVAATHAMLEQSPALKWWLSKYLEVDPLVALSTALSTHTLFMGLLWSLIILIPTLLLGRFFCGWICPFGISHHFIGWLFNRRKPRQRIEVNQYRRYYAIKYYILVGLLMAAVLHLLQIGMLDPICLLHRSLTTAILPAIGMPLAGVGNLGDQRFYALAWLTGFILFALWTLNLVVPRFFCRAMCPLGALLGLLSRFSLWRIYRDPQACRGCNRCVQWCEGACDPHDKLRKSECFVCFNCIDECPHGALTFRFLPPRDGEITNPDARRRWLMLGGLTGLLLAPFARTTGRATRNFSSQALRPPGAVEETEFLKRCIKCDQCVKVCPTNVLQPATTEGGIEGLWTPVMNYRMGFCQTNCTACSQVCPTGAIQPISVNRKLGLGSHKADGPIRMGTAHYDLGRCLPWANNMPCLVCQEVCPVSPKAIYSVPQRFLVRDGHQRVASVAGQIIHLVEAGTGGADAPGRLDPNEYRGDQTRHYYLEIVHHDGNVESAAIAGNDARSITLLPPSESQPALRHEPQPGELANIYLELQVPRIDLTRCIGCGQCENRCPVVGDRRAVYVTAEGETRSRTIESPDRNRSVQLSQ